MNSVVPTTYAIRVDDHLDDHWSGWFGSRTIVHNSDGTSTLTAAITDQAQLHGMLARLRDIGVTLLDLHATEGATGLDRRPVLQRSLRTARLTLRPAHADDAEATWRYRRLESVNGWLTGHPADIAGHRGLFTDPAILGSTIIVRLGHDPSAEVIGDLLLRRQDAAAHQEVADQARGVHAELGWVFDPAHRGHGYATEAVCELLRYGVEDLGMRRVTARSFRDDEASWRLMESVGMRRETHAVREFLHRSGRWLDTVTYALLTEEPRT